MFEYIYSSPLSSVKHSRSHSYFDIFFQIDVIDTVAQGVLQLHHLNPSWDDKTLVFEIEKVLALSRSKNVWVRIWFRNDEDSGT